MAAPDYVNEAEISSLKLQIADLTSLIYQLAVDKLQTMEACRICARVGHPTNMCPILREESYERMNVVSDFPGQPQERYDPYSYTYNSGWSDHDFGYGNPQTHQFAHQNFPSYQQYGQPYPQQQQGQSSNSSMSIEDMFKQLTTNTLQLQQDTLQFKHDTRASTQNLETQIGQMATAISRLEAQGFEQLPSHTMVDQEEETSEIELRSGNEVENSEQTAPTLQKQEEADNIKADSVNEDRDVLCDDDIPTVAEVVERTDKEKLDDAITNVLGLEKEKEIEQKEAETALHSVPVTLNKYAEFSIPVPVTNNKFLPFILQTPIPGLKFLPNRFTYLLLEEGVKHSDQPRGRLNLPLKDNVMDGIRKIHEIGVT